MKGDRGLFNKQSAKRIADTVVVVEQMHPPLVGTGLARRRVIPSKGDTYKGYFKPTQTAVNKIKIVDGFDSDNANCGNIAVNKLAIASVTATELTIAADAYIYLECVGVGDPLTSSTNTIVQYASEQAWEAGKEKLLISRVKCTEAVAPATTGTITDFSTERVPTRINIVGAC